MDTRSFHDSILIREYRRTHRHFQKLNARYLRRKENKSFDDLSKRKRYYLIRKLRKLKAKLDQLTMKLKMAVTAGAVAASVLLAIPEASAQAARVAQISENGNRITVNVSDDDTQDQMAFDVNANGETLVVWRDLTDNAIRAQRFDEERNKLGGEIDIAQGDTDISYSNPDVAIDVGGDFVVVFEKLEQYYDYENYANYYNNSLLIRRYNNDGTLDGASSANDEIELLTASEEDPFTDEAILPKIAMKEDGDFVLAWQTQGIYGDGQTYTAQSKTFIDESWGTVETLALATSINSKFPSVAIQNDGDFVVSWSEEMGYWSASDYYGIKYRRGDNTGSLGDEVTAFNASSPGSSTPLVEHPVVRMMDDDGVVVSFTGNNQNRIYSYRLNAQNNPLSNNNFFVSNPVSAFDMQVDNFGNRTVVYYDGSNISTRITDHFGNTTYSSNNFAMTNTNSVQLELLENEFVIGFNGDSRQDIYLQVFAQESPVTTIEGAQLSTDPTVGEFRLSEVDANGNFVAVWEETDSYSTNQIYAQRFNADGEKVGSVIQVNENTSSNSQSPRIAMDDDGDFLISWHQASYFQGQIFNSDGSPNGSNFDMIDSSVSSTYPFDIAYQDDLGIFIYVDGNFDVLARKLNGPDSFLSGATTVMDWTNNMRYPSVAMDDDGDAMIIWSQDYGDYNYIWGAVVASASTTASAPFAVDNSHPIENFQTAITSDADNSFIMGWQAPDGLKIRKANTENSGSTKSLDLSASRDNIYTISTSENEILVGTGSVVSIDLQTYNVLSELNSNFSDVNAVLANGKFFVGTQGRNPHLYINEMAFFSPVGNQRSINLESHDNHAYTQVSRNENGDYVIVWHEDDEGGEHTVVAQRFNNDHERLGNEMTIGSYGDIEDYYNSLGGDLSFTDEWHRYPDVHLADDGDFIVVWDAGAYYNGELVNVYLGGLFYKEFDAQEETLSSLRQLYSTNEASENKINIPQIDGDASGDFVVAWTEVDNSGPSRAINLRYQQFNASAEAINEPISMTNFDNDNGINSALTTVDVDDGGDFAISWVNIADNEGYDGYLRVTKVAKSGSIEWTQNFEEEGSPLFQIDDNNPLSSVTQLPDGSVAVIYMLQNGNIEFQILNSTDGNLVGESVQPFDLNWDDLPSILSSDLGIVVLGVEKNEGDRIVAARYTLDGKPYATSQTLIYDSSIQAADMDIDENGDVMVAYSAHGDGYGRGILALEILTPFPKVKIDDINVTEGESVDMKNLVAIDDNFGGEDWELKVLETTENGTITLGSETLGVGSSFYGNDVEANGIVYNHNGTETSVDRFEFEVKNNFGYGKTVKGPISITNTNDLPVLVTELTDQVTDEDESFTYAVAAGSFTDEETNPLTYTAELESGAALPEWLKLTGTSFSGTPANGDVGTINVKLIASDGVNSVSDVFELKVENVNDAPVASAIDDQTAKEGDPFSLTVKDKFSDVDVDDELTLSATQEDGSALPAWLTFNPSDGSFSGTPTTESVGTLFIKVTATDKAGLTASDVFAIEISATTKTNEPPQLVGDIADQLALVGQPYFLKIDVAGVFSDPDTPELTITVTQSNDTELPSWLSFDNEDNSLAGTPQEGDEGEFLIKVNASDGENTTSAVFKLTVEGEEKLGLEDGGIAVFPNPTSEFLRLDWQDNLPKQIRVYNYEGKLTLKTHLEKGARLDVSKLPVGNYVLKVGTDEIATFKFIKTRND